MKLLDELTWPEVYEKISLSDVAYFPVGTQEGHGAHLPMGTDMYIATATAILAAERTGGVVLHPLAYSFTGATNAFRGTVSIPMHLEMEVIKAVVRNLWGQGFRAIWVVSCHGPNDIPIMMAIRELFEYERTVAAYFNPSRSVDAGKYGYDDPARETAMCYAAMEILGLGEKVRDIKAEASVQLPPLDLPGKEGLATGYHYTDMRQHVPARKVDIDIGRKLLEEAAEQLAARTEDLRSYARFVEDGGNPPFSVEP